MIRIIRYSIQMKEMHEIQIYYGDGIGFSLPLSMLLVLSGCWLVFVVWGERKHTSTRCQEIFRNKKVRSSLFPFEVPYCQNISPCGLRSFQPKSLVREGDQISPPRKEISVRRERFQVCGTCYIQGLNGDRGGLVQNCSSNACNNSIRQDLVILFFPLQNLGLREGVCNLLQVREPGDDSELGLGPHLSLGSLHLTPALSLILGSLHSFHPPWLAK